MSNWDKERKTHLKEGGPGGAPVRPPKALDTTPDQGVFHPGNQVKLTPEANARMGAVVASNPPKGISDAEFAKHPGAQDQVENVIRQYDKYGGPGTLSGDYAINPQNLERELIKQGVAPNRSKAGAIVKEMIASGRIRTGATTGQYGSSVYKVAPRMGDWVKKPESAWKPPTPEQQKKDMAEIRAMNAAKDKKMFGGRKRRGIGGYGEQ